MGVEKKDKGGHLTVDIRVAGHIEQVNNRGDNICVWDRGSPVLFCHGEYV